MLILMPESPSLYTLERLACSHSQGCNQGNSKPLASRRSTQGRVWSEFRIFKVCSRSRKHQLLTLTSPEKFGFTWVMRFLRWPWFEPWREGWSRLRVCTCTFTPLRSPALLRGNPGFPAPLTPDVTCHTLGRGPGTSEERKSFLAHWVVWAWKERWLMMRCHPSLETLEKTEGALLRVSGMGWVCKTSSQRHTELLTFKSVTEVNCYYTNETGGEPCRIKPP